jgi:hypothetical protein
MLLAIIILVVIIGVHTGKQEKKAKTTTTDNTTTTTADTLSARIKAITGLRSVTTRSVIMNASAFSILSAAYAYDNPGKDATMAAMPDIWTWYDMIAGDQSGDRLGAEFRIAPRLRKGISTPSHLEAALQNVINLCVALKEADTITQQAAITRLARTCRSDAASNHGRVADDA